ncbi:TPA: hypothetical protein ACYUTL_002563 [Serratia marcescens]
MVTYNSMWLAPPKSWDEFEDMCKSSFQLRWSNPNLNRHGRSGQKQDGVDVYGADSFGHFVGIQCKNTVSGISRAIIDDELLKAEKFNPKITALYIATTAPRDVNIQSYVRTLNDARRLNSLFPVDVAFWDDVSFDLRKDPSVLRMYYPQMFEQHQPTREELLRKRDISNLSTLLNVIDFSSTIDHLQWGAKYIHSLIISEYDNILNTLNSSVFQLSDADLERVIYDFATAWSNLISLFRKAPYNYLASQDTFSFINPGDFCRNQEENDLYDEITHSMGNLQVKISNFCDFINNHYHEINLTETSAKARKYY